jgi:hypothetical protein
MVAKPTAPAVHLALSFLFDPCQDTSMSFAVASLSRVHSSFSALCLLACASFIGNVTAFAQSPVKTERVGEIASWLPADPCGSGVPVTNRGPWEALAADKRWAALIQEAESLAKKPCPDLPDSLYLDFSKTGNRVRCQKVLSQRDGRMGTLALAECLEAKGRFIEPLAETIRAICSERTWMMPAHDRKLESFNGRAMDLDLRATLIGWDLATIHYVLGPRLPAETRRLIETEVQRRILAPFRGIVEGRQRGAYWLNATHNWNSVCLAGVTCAALALEPKAADRAWFVAASEHYIKNFLRGFTADGYCSEGLGYWNYGFGRFLMLGEGVRQATGGKLDLLADPAAKAPALYALRSEVINGIYPTIADCHPGGQPDSSLLKLIAERFGLDLPQVKGLTFANPGKSVGPVLMFAFLENPLPRIPSSAEAPELPLRTWFADGGVLICRPAPGTPAFAAVLKGGHNAEHHNHNDVGSFSVISGRTMLVCDPGAEVYTARTFGSKRYDSKVLSSIGHAVPVIGGTLQRTGAEAKAAILKTEFSDKADLLSLDIKSAYSVPELRKLNRTFEFERGNAPRLVVTDTVECSEAKTFESALITWGEWKQVSPREIIIRDGADAVKVGIDTGGQEFSVSSEVLDEDVSTPKKPVRLAITLKAAVQTAKITITLSPAN